VDAKQWRVRLQVGEAETGLDARSAHISPHDNALKHEDVNGMLENTGGEEIKANDTKRNADQQQWWSIGNE
jgi:hypothetical protein